MKNKMMPYLVMGALILIGIFLLPHLKGPSMALIDLGEGTVARTIPTILPGGTATISLVVNAGSTDGTVLIEENIPSGVTVTGASNSGDYATTPGKIYWVVLSGITDSVFTYTVNTPATQMACEGREFYGTYLFDQSTTTETSIGGDMCLEYTTCGNGACDSGETYLTCPSDCEAPPKADGETCALNTECLNANCIHTVCRTTSTYCGDSYCDAGETSTSCSADCEEPLLVDGADCTLSSECASNACYNSLCVAVMPKANGETCVINSDCISNNCVNTVCAEVVNETTQEPSSGGVFTPVYSPTQPPTPTQLPLVSPRRITPVQYLMFGILALVGFIAFQRAKKKGRINAETIKKWAKTNIKGILIGVALFLAITYVYNMGYLDFLAIALNPLFKLVQDKTATYIVMALIGGGIGGYTFKWWQF